MTVPRTPGNEAQAPPDTILVVEGEVLVRMVIAEYLRECGFRVLEARSNEEAFRVLRADDSVDVVFTGVTGGDAEGFALAQWVRRERPLVKVVLSSGLRRATTAAGELCESGPQLAKPYEPREAERRIRRLMAQTK